MIEINLLLVEDNEQDQQNCLNAAHDYGEDHTCKINITVCKYITEAQMSVSNFIYDGAIIDMKLAGDGNEGNEVIKTIKNDLKRIPVAIMTGTPDVAEVDGFPLLFIYKKKVKTF
jgi:DNA-binding NtrC family response regulator